MYDIHTVIIGDTMIDELIDEEGVKWYPLTWFITKVLRKSRKTADFRDSTISRYMKVIEYSADRPGMRSPKKVWCINEKGIKFLLKKMTVNRVGEPSQYKTREKGFYEAALFFDVKSALARFAPTFINHPPNINDYDVWSAICLEYDDSLNTTSIWKVCPECNYYYPYSQNYFGKNINEQSKCLQCKGKNFKCKNKIIQFIYDNGGLEFLYKLKNYEQADTIIKEFWNFANGEVSNENKRD